MFCMVRLSGAEAASGKEIPRADALTPAPCPSRSGGRQGILLSGSFLNMTRHSAGSPSFGAGSTPMMWAMSP